MPPPRAAPGAVPAGKERQVVSLNDRHNLSRPVIRVGSRRRRALPEPPIKREHGQPNPPRPEKRRAGPVPPAAHVLRAAAFGAPEAAFEHRGVVFVGRARRALGREARLRHRLGTGGLRSIRGRAAGTMGIKVAILTIASPIMGGVGGGVDITDGGTTRSQSDTRGQWTGLRTPS